MKKKAKKIKRKLLKNEFGFLSQIQQVRKWVT
jgi:hypothetical protein